MTRFSSAARPVRTLALLAAASMALTLAACGNKGDATGAGGAQGAKAMAPVVGVLTVQPGTVVITTELPGRLEANKVAQVRARTAGVVLRRLYREGSDVKEGVSLFQIDNAPQQAALQSARASLAKAQASLAQASDTARRYKPLVEANAISKQEYVTAQANERAARADVLSGQAAVRTAQINLGYSYVRAPISGRIGKAQVTEGALVGQTDSTLLATIQQLDPMVVNFTQSASDLMKLRKSLASGSAESAGGNPPVKVVLDDGSIYGTPGRLLFTDATVDPTTGQVNLKAEIPNPQHVLLPGLYVRVQVELARIEHAVLIPQQAVTRGTTGDTVMVVNADGSFAPRPVTVAQAQGNSWVVTGGLKAGDKVIVDGMSVVQMMRAKKVTPQPWQPPKQAASAPVAAPAPAAAASAGGVKGAASTVPAASK